MGLFRSLLLVLLIAAPILVRLEIVDRGGLVEGFVDLETRAGSSIANMVEQSITMVERSARGSPEFAREKRRAMRLSINRGSPTSREGEPHREAPMADNLASEARTELTALATTYRRNQALSEAGAGFGLGGLGAAFPPVAEFAEPLGAAFDAAAFKNEAVSADLKELASNIAAHPGEAQALLNAAASKYETAAHEELGAGILAGRVFPPIGVALGAAALKNNTVARDIDKIAEKTYHPSGDLGHQRVDPVEVIRNADLHHVRGESKIARLRIWRRSPSFCSHTGTLSSIITRQNHKTETNTLILLY